MLSAWGDTCLLVKLLAEGGNLAGLRARADVGDRHSAGWLARGWPCGAGVASSDGVHGVRRRGVLVDGVTVAMGVPGSCRGWQRACRARCRVVMVPVCGDVGDSGCGPGGRGACCNTSAPGPGWPVPGRLGDALNAVAAAVDCARRNFGHGPEMTWPLAGRLGLARFLMPVPAS